MTHIPCFSMGFKKNLDFPCLPYHGFSWNIHFPMHFLQKIVMGKLQKLGFPMKLNFSRVMGNLNHPGSP